MIATRIRNAWIGRVSGCMLGKPVEVLSFQQGRPGIEAYLRGNGAWPLRDYVPWQAGRLPDANAKPSCRGHMVRAQPDDDINYSVLALMLLEDHGLGLRTEDVARAWLRLLPAGVTWTAERAAYLTLLERMADEFVNGAAAGFDLSECADNDYNEWIGGQIRADLYAWVCPGRPGLAADLARRDASLSHRGDGLHGAAFIAALGALIAVETPWSRAVAAALEHIPASSEAVAAVRMGLAMAHHEDGLDRLHEHYKELPPVHTLNNLALVVWALSRPRRDFATTVGDTVAAGWDTDCNGATVGGLYGLSGAEIPASWERAWGGRIGVSLAGISELCLDELVNRTLAVSEHLAREVAA